MQTSRDNHSFGCAGLVAGTGATVSIANAMAYAIAGRTYQKAAATNVAFALKTGGVALPVLAASQIGCIFLWLDTAGALTYSSATTSVGVARVAINSTAAGYAAGGFEWPQDEAAYACIGAIRIATNASGAFTIGTTALGAANTTAVFHNVGGDYGVSIPF